MSTFGSGGAIEYLDHCLYGASVLKADSANFAWGPWLPLITGTTGGIIADAGLPGGAIQLTVAAEEDGATQLVGPKMFEADVGPFMLEVDLRVSVDASTAAAVFVGFTDNNSVTLEVPIEDEDGTLETDASDAVGFMLEAEQDATWQAVSVDTDVDGAQTALTGASDYAVGTWQRLRVTVNKSGTASFYVATFDSNNNLGSWQGGNGGAIHSRDTAVTTSVALAPIISLDSRGAAVTLQVRRIMFRGSGLEVSGS